MFTKAAMPQKLLRARQEIQCSLTATRFNANCKPTLIGHQGMAPNKGQDRQLTGTKNHSQQGLDQQVFNCSTAARVQKTALITVQH